MPLKTAVRKAVNRLTGLHVYRSPPRGANLFWDLRRCLPHVRPEVVFDVGANVGQSTEEYLAAFPHAHVHAFEPVGTTAAQLKKRFAGNPRVSAHEVALSDRQGTAVMEVAEQSVASRLAADQEGGQRVTLDTLDHFCASNGVPHIGFIKIDTEGHDLAVLQGASSMLASRSIDVVEVEAGMSPDNERHARFEDIKALMESHGYRLFGLYEQAREFPTNRQHLRRTNPVFVSPSVVEANRG